MRLLLRGFGCRFSGRFRSRLAFEHRIERSLRLGRQWRGLVGSRGDGCRDAGFRRVGCYLGVRCVLARLCGFGSGSIRVGLQLGRGVLQSGRVGGPGIRCGSRDVLGSLGLSREIVRLGLQSSSVCRSLVGVLLSSCSPIVGATMKGLVSLGTYRPRLRFLAGRTTRPRQ